MKLTPTDLAAIATIVLAAILLATRDDPRWWHAVRRAWSNKVGAFCAQRRARIRVPAPDEHSPGIMSARRDINVGSWT